jgi:hypothetical protein
MSALLAINPGVTINAGVTLNGYAPSGGPAPGDITITYNEFNYPGGGPTGVNLEDGSVTGTGIVINSIYSGVLMAGLTAPNLLFVSANLPDSGPGGIGEIWTAHWSANSTYSTTPVAIYYTSSGYGGHPCITFWVLDPADSTYHTGTAGTFNFPMTLTAGTTPTSFED